MKINFFHFSAALAFPAPSPDTFLEILQSMNPHGGELVENTFSRTVCGVFNFVDTAAHQIKKTTSPKNYTEVEAFEYFNNMVSLQKTPLETPFALADARQPEWLTIFALYNGFNYCKTRDPSQMAGFGLPNPKLTESPDHMLPTGHFTLNSLNDFNAFNGVKANASQLDGRFIVTTDDKHRLITLTWRGSQTLNDFLADGVGTGTLLTDDLFQPYADVNPANSDGIVNEKCRIPKNIDDNYFVFAGFLHVMHQSVQDITVQKLKEAYSLHPDYSIVINGHSLGAVKSFFTGFYLAKFYSEQLPIAAVYTYEQPLIGSTLVSTWMADCIEPSKIIRVVAGNDAIPWMRAASNVQHPSTVLEQYNPDPTQNIWSQCMGPSDEGCSKQTTCTKKSWEFHSFIGGVHVGGPICWWINNYHIKTKVSLTQKLSQAL